jgi:hypothetical protein
LYNCCKVVQYYLSSTKVVQHYLTTYNYCTTIRIYGPGPQTRNWTSFIEAITAEGRVLVPGIIFKGKELQKQWFLEEFKQIADWYYITSPNGWTDDHIGIEWLERVYLPQTTPADKSDGRLIILDGHGSHATVCPSFSPSQDQC